MRTKTIFGSVIVVSITATQIDPLHCHTDRPIFECLEHEHVETREPRPLPHSPRIVSVGSSTATSVATIATIPTVQSHFNLQK